MANIEKLFGTFTQMETYQRVDGVHPLDLYVGIDDAARWTLLLVSDSQPPHITPSKMILIKTGKRPDGRWALSFSLVDDKYRDMFVLFCEDVIVSSSSFKDKGKATYFLCERYKEWREMLANTQEDLLSPQEVKGLLGEMYFLKEYFAPLYGIEVAALSWTGPKRLAQDYIISDTWYEVKTISSSRTEVSISSIEQLDCVRPGELVVLRADKTSVTNTRAVNLNVLYKQLMAGIPSDQVREEFSNMLLRYGYYPRPEYEDADFTFEIKGMSRYCVSSDFPCIRRANLPESVAEASYSLSLAVIDAYRKE